MHTPKPWKTKGPAQRDGAEDFAILDESGEIIAEAFGRSAIDKFHPSMANARLIASAPDLLAALENIVTASDANDEGSLVNAIQEGIAAIAKARGE